MKRILGSQVKNQPIYNLDNWQERQTRNGALISNQIACHARLREYGLRMSIEQSFPDDKSRGFNLEHTRLQYAQRLDHLLLAIAIATLWYHELGEFVLHTKRRCALPSRPSP